MIVGACVERLWVDVRRGWQQCRYRDGYWDGSLQYVSVYFRAQASTSEESRSDVIGCDTKTSFASTRPSPLSPCRIPLPAAVRQRICVIYIACALGVDWQVLS